MSIKFLSIICFMYIHIPFLQWIFSIKQEKISKIIENHMRIVVILSNLYYILQFILISFKVQVIKSPIKWFVNIRELPLKSIGKENICKRTSRTVWSNPSKSVAYIHIYRLRKWLIYMRRNPLSWIMKRLFCRREAVARDARSLQRQWGSLRTLCPRTRVQGEA